MRYRSTRIQFAIVTLIIGLVAALVMGLAPSRAAVQVPLPEHDGGVGRCTTTSDPNTGAAGFCVQPHTLGVVPTDIQVTMVRGGTSAQAEQQTSAQFKVQVFNGATPVPDGTDIVYWWHAWARPGISPSTTTTTSTSTTTTTLTSTTTTTLPPPPPPPNVSPLLVPLKGTWWGSYTGPDPAAVPARETLSGRKFDIVQYYHDWNDSFPTAGEKTLAAGGRFLRLIFNGRDFSNSANNVNWCQIAGGGQDANIRRIAGNVKVFGSKLFLTFTGEPEGADGVSCTGRTGTVGGYGTAAEFVAAWRHVHDVFAAEGVTNAVWVNSMANPSSTTANSFYVGDAFTDWLGWDPYNWWKCRGHNDSWIELAAKMNAFYSWAQLNHPDKALMLGEYGSEQPDTALPSKGDWFRTAAVQLPDQRPAVKAIILFDRLDSDCNWKFDSSVDAMAGWQDMGKAAIFNQPHA